MDPQAVMAAAHLLWGKSPRKMTVAVTYACNLRCKTCNIWKIYREFPELAKKELSTDEWRRVFTNVHPYYVSVTGGEPTLRPDLPEIVAAMAKGGVRALSINTNGAQPRKILEAAEAFRANGGNIVRVHVSIMGPKGLDESIRGKGSYEQAINAITTFENVGIDVYAEVTISRYNEDRIVETIEDLNKNGVPNRKIIITFYNEADYYGTRGKPWKASVDTVDTLLKLGGWSTEMSIFLKLSKKYIGGTKTYCPAGKISVFIDPYGNVYPCIIRTDHPLGNLRENMYSVVRILEKNRKRVEEIRKTCAGCWTPCESITGMVSNPGNVLIDLLSIK